jgi:hypothetical protein
LSKSTIGTLSSLFDNHDRENHVKGRKKQKRDIASGRWLTICPLLFGDGELGFCSFVVQGKFPVERSTTTTTTDAEAEALATGEQVDSPTSGAWGRAQVLGGYIETRFYAPPKEPVFLSSQGTRFFSSH